MRAIGSHGACISSSSFLNSSSAMHHLLLLLLLLFWWWPQLCTPTSLQRIPGFVSLDCGSSNPWYNDTLTGILWESDSSLGLAASAVSSTAANVTPPPTSSAADLVSNAQLTSFRYFPGNQSKYCYTLDDSTNYTVTFNSTYLVRATFWSGPTTSALPFTPKTSYGPLRFQLHLNADVWTNISIPLPQTTVLQQEVLVVAISPSISVCLSGAAAIPDFDTPFISSLEIREIPIDADSPLPSALRPSAATTRAVFTAHRVDYGSSTGVSVRYPDDLYDRIWRAHTSTPQINTTADIDVGSPQLAPIPVMQTAFTDTGYIWVYFTDLADGDYLYLLFFAEISPDVNATRQRIFSYSVATGASNTRVGYLNDIDIFALAGKNDAHRTNSKAPYTVLDNYLTFNFTRNNASIFGPLLSGLELYQVSANDASLGTDDVDAAAVSAIISAFPVALASWSGDPCLPYPHDWLRCDSSYRPRIISLSLPNKALSGDIPSSIANLTELQILDLHGNDLSGQIPDFLGSLPKLTTLFLQDNNFSGDVPQVLLDKANSFQLKFSFSGNPNLCSATRDTTTDSSSCKTKKQKNNIPVVVGATIGGVLLLFVGTIVICFVRRRYKQRTTDGRDGHQNAIQMITKMKGSTEDGYVIDRVDVNQIYCFTYQEIAKITNSFSRKLGSGGFGDVYHGILSHGVHVAIKVSTKDSGEGAQAFLNEVALLSRLHHKNLVKLIGYCKENKLMLIYEYMPNGSLESILQENELGKLRLTWSHRLKIAIGSAEGLEYLHKGCTPPIIHRDVKSSNILLDEDMEGKISDFGISRSTKSSSTDHTVTNVVGSKGYLPPDIINFNKINEKVDVYAFGVVLLELVTGQKPILTDGYTQHHVTDWVKLNIAGGGLKDIVDPTIDQTYNASSMWKVIDVAMMCVSQESNARPQMSDVSLDLKSALAMESEGNDHNALDFPTSFSMNPANVELYVR